jgi:glycosyltransferase involved in cell wall biosynthesis
MPSDASPRSEKTLAFVLKGFPRLSELFIASEIHRLEQAGLRLRVFVIKPPEERAVHPVVERIRARPDHLPACGPLSGVPLRRWLAENLHVFLPELRRVAMRKPAAVGRAAAAALAQAIRARPSFWSPPRKTYVKEFLQASALANRLLEAGDVAHLHAHFCHGATTVTWLASLMTGIPFSFTAHAKDLYLRSLNPAGLLRRKLAAARFAVTCTEANRRHLQTIANGTAVHRIYHGLNAEITGLVEQLPPSRAANRYLRILGVGRLVPKKGFDVLVEACRILRQRGIPFQAVIAGESGPDEAKLRRRAAELGMAAQIRLEGPLSQAELYLEYLHASVFALPCRVSADGDRDGIPNVLMEAMACGLPVVTTCISGIPELVSHELNGLLVPPENPVALADAIARIQGDPALAARLSSEARATVDARFNGFVLAEGLAALFRQVVA